MILDKEYVFGSRLKFYSCIVLKSQSLRVCKSKTLTGPGRMEGVVDGIGKLVVSG